MPSGILKKPCANLNKEYLFLYLAKKYSRIWKEWDYVKILTDFLEENKNKWNETKDDSILLEVGKRLTKEIIENTDDNTNLIDKLNG